MDSDSQSINIGRELKAAREAQGASLEDISARLKIRDDHLQALENDDFDRLPGHVYAIGFIRTYATHLDLNAADLINRFKEATMVLPVEEGAYNEAANGEPVSLGLKLGLAGFAVFLVYLMWLIAGGAGPDQRQANAPRSTSEAASEAKAGATSELKGVAAPASRPVAPAAPVIATPKPTSEPVLSNEPAVSKDDGASVIAGEPVQAVGEAGSIVVAPLAAPAEETPSIAEVLAAQKVEIRASRRTWMRIENEAGRVLFSSIIRDGESFELEEETPYTLATRDAGALHYHVNDTKVGNVGRRGQILTSRQIDRAAIIALQP